MKHETYSVGKSGNMYGKCTLFPTRFHVMRLKFGTKGKLPISMNCTQVIQNGRLWNASVVSKQSVVSNGRFMSLTRICLSSTVHKVHVHTTLVLTQTNIDRLTSILLHMNQKTGYFSCSSLSSHYIRNVAYICHVLQP
jgi:hypothetical protein